MDNRLRINFPLTTWRLLITPASSGSWNMAVDEAILRNFESGDNRATLRLYAWDPACLSLGYAQPISDADFAALDERGWDVVRRPTGGKAILHTDELTYSVIAPPSEPRMNGGVLESYQRIAQAMLHALRSLDIPAESSPLKSILMEDDAAGPVCFDVPSNYEITVLGKKLVGSAQARKKEGVLQHGTLPLYGDLTRITQVLTYHKMNERENAASKLLERATTVKQVLGYEIAWEKAASALVNSFQTILNLEFEPLQLSQKEQELAAELQDSKYTHPTWMNRI